MLISPKNIHEDLKNRGGVHVFKRFERQLNGLPDWTD